MTFLFPNSCPLNRDVRLRKSKAIFQLKIVSGNLSSCSVESGTFEQVVSGRKRMNGLAARKI